MATSVVEIRKTTPQKNKKSAANEEKKSTLFNDNQVVQIWLI